MRLTPDWVGLCLKGGAVWKTSFGISTSHTNLYVYLIDWQPDYRLVASLSPGPATYVHVWLLSLNYVPVT